MEVYLSIWLIFICNFSHIRCYLIYCPCSVVGFFTLYSIKFSANCIFKNPSICHCITIYFVMENLFLQHRNPSISLSRVQSYPLIFQLFLQNTLPEYKGRQLKTCISTVLIFIFWVLNCKIDRLSGRHKNNCWNSVDNCSNAKYIKNLFKVLNERKSIKFSSVNLERVISGSL